MSKAGSIGTTMGMRMYYARIPNCTECRKVKCFKGYSPFTRLCSKCFKKVTGITYREYIETYVYVSDPEKRMTFPQIVKHINKFIADKKISPPLNKTNPNASLSKQ